MSGRRYGGPIHTERVARKRHRCAWDCGSPIEPGSRYVRSALPPGADPNTDDHWWTQSLHGHTQADCPTYGPGRVDPRIDHPGNA